MILVVTNAYDDVANLVIKKLRDRKASWARFNVPAFPGRTRLAFDPTALEGGTLVDEDGEEIDLANVTSAWIWKPLRRKRLDALEPGEGEFLQDASERTCQCFTLLLAPFTFTVNQPEMTRLAEDKGFQLRLARSLGLAVPPTLVTNSPVRARAFCLEHREVVFKLINRPQVFHRGRVSWIGTNLVEARDTRNR
ncbi:MvdC/MvdD family ATP grasp protein [Mesoterricola silvestris]|uniref:MvdD-like pre-ATP grasp domain-containing protein n=1 Tax=Mesoterricola silvestris TaxID=2927979 RepID=A0AA48GNC9_9BACT|nr:hypothetical protein [Mesoterricola silvestris]BDU74514.1 hypothetical protein METEAL_36880 [Mesoterricola silvestris]